jgi:hypothetical protein
MGSSLADDQLKAISYARRIVFATKTQSFRLRTKVTYLPLSDRAALARKLIASLDDMQEAETELLGLDLAQDRAAQLDANPSLGISSENSDGNCAPFLSAKHEGHSASRCRFRDCRSALIVPTAQRKIANDFYRAYLQTRQLVCDNPQRDAVIRIPSIRKHSMAQFPYNLIYRVVTINSEQYLQILAIAHHSRRPYYWQQRR